MSHRAVVTYDGPSAGNVAGGHLARSVIASVPQDVDAIDPIWAFVLERVPEI
jgi:hypothetical protein